MDLSALEQFVEEGQTNMVVDVLKHIQASAPQTVGYWVRELDKLMAAKGTNIGGDQRPYGNLARARPLEMLSAVNRVRGLSVKVRR